MQGKDRDRTSTHAGGGCSGTKDGHRYGGGRRAEARAAEKSSAAARRQVTERESLEARYLSIVINRLK